MSTLLALQRTTLAYIRTGLALVGFGMKMKDKTMMYLGIISLAVGLYQHRTLSKSIRDEGDELPNDNLPIFITLAGLGVMIYRWS